MYASPIQCRVLEGALGVDATYSQAQTYKILIQLPPLGEADEAESCITFQNNCGENNHERNI